MEDPKSEIAFLSKNGSPKRITPVPSKLVNSRWYETMGGRFHARDYKNKPQSALPKRDRYRSDTVEQAYQSGTTLNISMNSGYLSPASMPNSRLARQQTPIYSNYPVTRGTSLLPAP